MVNKRTRARLPAKSRHSGTVNTSVTAKVSGQSVSLKEDIAHTKVTDIQDVPNPARVRVGGGITKAGDRDFEFIRVDISVELPCKPDKVSVRNCYIDCAELVDEMIEEELNQAHARLG